MPAGCQGKAHWTAFSGGSCSVASDHYLRPRQSVALHLPSNIFSAACHFEGAKRLRNLASVKAYKTKISRFARNDNPKGPLYWSTVLRRYPCHPATWHMSSCDLIAGSKNFRRTGNSLTAMALQGSATAPPFREKAQGHRELLNGRREMAQPAPWCSRG
jgi:hypothetical protein